MIAPAVSNVGTANVSGGSSGGAAVAGTVTANPRIGGGGGGGCIGSGGFGGDVLADGSVPAPSDAASGLLLITLADPTSLF